MLNKVMLIGNLGAEPDAKNVNGATVCQFSVATTERWMDKQNVKQERTEWHRVVVWNKLAENCSKYLHKGSKVYVEGKIATRTWEKDGTKHYATEIKGDEVRFLSPKSESSGAPSGPNDFGPEPSFAPNDEIPF